MLVLSFMLSEMFRHLGQSCISKRSGQTNEIIAELVNYHHFHSLTTCNIYGIMVLDRFIVVFVWEAFGLRSHLLKHIAQPLECIMEMNCCVFFFINPDMTCFFFFCSSVFLSSNSKAKEGVGKGKRGRCSERKEKKNSTRTWVFL